jgi:hypothetical protein
MKDGTEIKWRLEFGVNHEGFQLVRRIDWS